MYDMFCIVSRIILQQMTHCVIDISHLNDEIIENYSRSQSYWRTNQLMLSSSWWSIIIL